MFNVWTSLGAICDILNAHTDDIVEKSFKDTSGKVFVSEVREFLQCNLWSKATSPSPHIQPLVADGCTSLVLPDVSSY